MKVSKKDSGVEYAIRDIVSAAKDLEKQGQTIDYLNIGDPVQYGFHPPENVKQAYIDAIKKDQNYNSASEGIQELRSAIAEKENSMLKHKCKTEYPEPVYSEKSFVRCHANK